MLQGMISSKLQRRKIIERVMLFVTQNTQLKCVTRPHPLTSVIVHDNHAPAESDDDPAFSGTILRLTGS